MFLKALASTFAGNNSRRNLTIAVSSTVVTALTAAGYSQLAQRERELTFRVEPGTASWYSGLPQGVIEANLPIAANGKTEHIHTWWWPAARKDAPAVLYLHGARWNLTGHVFRIAQLRNFGFSVFAIDYRGFGKSDGDYPSEQTAYEDARIAWMRLAQLQPDPAKRFIYGHSLGGAIAVDLAAKLADHAPASAGLMIESSFSSLADIARSFTYPWLPVELVMSQRFDSASKIKRVDVPVLIVHGREDSFLSSQLSEKLYAAATGKKKLLLVEDGTHNNCIQVGQEEYRRALAELFHWGPRAA